MIPLNKPFLPPLDVYKRYIEEIWNRNWLTNHGPLVREFEQKLSDYLGLDETIFLNNGTTALQVAIKALNLSGEIITTPFSYVATCSSIVWQHCTPVFVDIDEHSLTIDADKIEDAITDKTSAILATHVFGNPCDVEAIQSIAGNNQLKVIYDAAHCFGITYKGKSILEWGDVSTISFHATKLFHTTEGGALYSNNKPLMNKMRAMMNFGHDGPYNYTVAGINGKNSEFHAAMGLCNLIFADRILEKRRHLAQVYQKKLSGLPLHFPEIRKNTKYNYAYFPVLFESEQMVNQVQAEFTVNSIESRRYFYPGLNTLPYVAQKKMPVTDSITQRILCLPFYYDLTEKEIESVSGIIRKTLVNVD